MPSASNVAEVEAIKEYLEGSVAAVLTEYRGLKVKELGELRASLRGSSTDYRVLKNTLTSIAVRDKGYEELLPLLEGPTAVAFVHGDPVQAAKDLAEFARRRDPPARHPGVARGAAGQDRRHALGAAAAGRQPARRPAPPGGHHERRPARQASSRRRRRQRP